MNFSPFGSPFSTSIPSLHQFAAKFSQENVSTLAENSSRYTANGIPSFTHHHHATPQSQSSSTVTCSKYSSYLNAQSLYGTSLGTASTSTTSNKKPTFADQHQELTQELCNALLQNQQEKVGVSLEKIKVLDDVRLNSNLLTQTQTQSSPASPWQSLASSSSTVADYLSSTLPLSLHHFLKYSAETLKKETTSNEILFNNSTSISNIFNVGNNNTNQNATQNVSNGNGNSLSNGVNNLSTINTAHLSQSSEVVVIKKKKKKSEKEKKPKPRPGEIRLTTALDGSTLYCCPECHMAYPERELLEQHLLGHTMERRFVCDICGAGLKRKDHLTRHKQSHNPERPYICSVCLKAFKRKEQLTLHFVIHSGEKRHVCTECGKGFYRKDHLRKHTRSHIARRVKSELTQQGTSLPSLSTVSASNMMT